jgi:hypothetical protein
LAITYVGLTPADFEGEPKGAGGGGLDLDFFVGVWKMEARESEGGRVVLGPVWVVEDVEGREEVEGRDDLDVDPRCSPVRSRMGATLEALYTLYFCATLPGPISAET